MARTLSGSRKWTQEEVIYLEDNWGSVSVNKICKHLGRTQEAIKLKACRIGLGRALDIGEYITLTQLIQGLGMSADGSTTKRLVGAGLPTIRKKLYTQTFKVIPMDKFWKWAEKNQDMLDFRNFKYCDLGPEPGWVNVKRAADLQKQRTYRQYYKCWTKNEEEMLIFLVNEQKFTYLEIATTLGRTEGAIERKLYDLGIQNKPKRLKAKPYTKEDDQKIIEMYNKNYRRDMISRELMRSAQSVGYRINVLKKKGLIA